MNTNIKLFIEENIDLIDNNEWEKFFNKAEALWKDTEDYTGRASSGIWMISNYLMEAGIDTSEIRKELFLKELVEKFRKKSFRELLDQYYTYKRWGERNGRGCLHLIINGLHPRTYGIDLKTACKYVRENLEMFVLYVPGEILTNEF